MNFNNTPYSKNYCPKVGKFARGVSIIGVGCTPFGSVFNTPGLKDLSDREMMAWAAQEAMVDAGITAKDVDAMIMAQIGSQHYYSQGAVNIAMLDWLGMRGKGGTRHESACASSYLAFEHACEAIASGKYDIVVLVGADTDKDFPAAYQPPHIRYPFSEFKSRPQHPVNAYNSVDHCYSRWFGNHLSWVDESAKLYMKKHGLTEEQMRDVQDALQITMRHNAAKNPLAHLQQEVIDEAKEHGYNDVKEYLHSNENRRYSEMTYRNQILLHSDGGGAMILCASDIAKKYRDDPIEILGSGECAMDCRLPMYSTRFKEGAFKQVFELTGLSGKDIDLMYTTDFTAAEILIAAEMVDYVPEGEGWKYALDGEFGYDGSKPINTQGGSMGFGHSWGGQIFEMMVEAVRQMRGECGERQVKKLPETVLVNGWGGQQLDVATILRINR